MAWHICIARVKACSTHFELGRRRSRPGRHAHCSARTVVRARVMADKAKANVPGPHHNRFAGGMNPLVVEGVIKKELLAQEK